ncbi:hypothetical protein SAMN04487983_100268 [Streptomyces sp. yr375]|uniref:hypothetical protein n=1 Tax=Streptomyces sp. yr375 TaxID=1761906 RepID=UPI0008C9081B|nr:hypothetical protein [Streptomyces sp. yr375]SEP87756.1 hypothetical protein SAMN04487983_100268 [Streptomyces sp. yr375]
MRRIKVTAAVFCAAALMAGCGGGGGTGSDADAKASAAADTAGSASAAPARPLGEAQLKSAALTGGDVDGFQITDFPVKPDGDSVARPADCQPLEDMRTGAPDPGPKAFTGLLAYAGAGPTAGSATTIGLMAYDGSSAAQGVLGGLRTALKTCTAYEGGVPARTTAKSATAPDVGDDAVAYSLQTERDSPDAFVVVRSGATVVLFFTATGTRTGSGAAVPEALVSAQIRKLEAQGSL